MTAPTSTAPFTLELEKLKICSFLSEETTAYEAILRINGIPAIRAHNEGHGGCDCFDPIYNPRTKQCEHALFKTAMEAVEAHLATLPDIVCDITEKDGSKFSYRPSLETLVGDKIAAAEKAKTVEKLVKSMKDRIIFLEGGKLWKTGKVAGISSKLLARFQAKNPKAKIFNSLPVEDARNQLLASGLV